MSSLYESSKVLSEYLLFHYGTADEILPENKVWPEGMRQALDFAVRTPGHFSKTEVARGLDLGCAVGRSTFEMAANCAEVVGIDYSHAFIEAAGMLLKSGFLGYKRREEGAITTSLTARLPEGVRGERVNFLQGDAMALPGNLGAFDRVHAANLICRLSDPVKLLDRLPSLVKNGGELVLATPCTWLEEFTPPGNWPDTDTLTWLKSRLNGSFSVVREAEEPFLIRETARKFQWTSSLVTVWTRQG